MKNIYIRTLRGVLLGTAAILAATAIGLFAVVNRGFNVSWRLWSKVLAGLLLIALWPVADRCLLHWAPTITGDSLIADIGSRLLWLTNLNLTLQDAPQGEHSYSLLGLLFGFAAVHVVICGLATSEHLKADAKDMTNAITGAAEHYLRQIGDCFRRKSPKPAPAQQVP